jgi:hypothetical protein
MGRRFTDLCAARAGPLYPRELFVYAGTHHLLRSSGECMLVVKDALGEDLNIIEEDSDIG